jgi:hypothetical protein
MAKYKAEIVLKDGKTELVLDDTLRISSSSMTPGGTVEEMQRVFYLVTQVAGLLKGAGGEKFEVNLIPEAAPAVAQP